MRALLKRMYCFTKVIIRITFRRERFQIKQEKYRQISFRVKTTISEIFMSQGLAVRENTDKPVVSLHYLQDLCDLKKKKTESAKGPNAARYGGCWDMHR